jgi:hypothetical protein
MINQDAELESFKREIDLRQFAVSLGYEIDRRESWRGSTVLRRGADKIVVKRSGNGHYVFFSVRDDGDHGTVIDFLQRRQNLSLGAVRQILRPWIGRPATSPQFPKLESAGPDRMRVEGAYRRMANAHRSPYLEHERCVPAAVLLSPRFAWRMRVDSLGNTVFPHFDAAGLCGYEIKNCGFTAFAAAKRVCGSRILSRTTGVWSWPKVPLMLSRMPRCFRTARTAPAMSAWVANQARGK